jgi:uncharacterized protein involved in exopolysaccharide biosynthesis
MVFVRVGLGFEMEAIGMVSRIDRPSRVKTVLLFAALGSIIGFLFSFVFHPRYTSSSFVISQPMAMVDFEPRKVDGSIPPGVIALREQALTGNNLNAMLERLNLAKSGEATGPLIDSIRSNMKFELAVKGPTEIVTPFRKNTPGWPVGFYVHYTDSSPDRAQKICRELVLMMLEVNLDNSLSDVKRQTEVLNTEILESNKKVGALDSQLGACRKGTTSNHKDDEKCKALTRDRAQLQAFRLELLNKLSQTKALPQLIRQHRDAFQSLKIEEFADFPKTLAFPNRLKFAAGGLGLGLICGISRILLLSRMVTAKIME